MLYIIVRLQVKALGVFAMIDDGELDWKVIVIDVNDPKAKELNDVADVEKVFPGELEKIRVWFRDYKMPDGKPANAFGLNDVCMDKVELAPRFALSPKVSAIHCIRRRRPALNTRGTTTACHPSDCGVS
jgi:hypothetical protein